MRARNTKWLAGLCASALPVALFVCLPVEIAAYSVLSHEAVIDSVWDTDIRHLLLKHFPDATEEKLKEAHGYAYGGAIIQDLGYYPHGRIFFSDLTHYLRSGDFVVALLHDATDLNGYAFALGALAHYASDIDGHRLGTNVAEPVLYPKLERKFGNVVTYEEAPLAHVKTEFGFDVLEVAKGRYAPDDYRNFIGFGVAAPVLEQAFRETYGLSLRCVLADEDKALGSYRHDVSSVIPKATRIAWSLKKKEIMKDRPGITKQKFLYNLSRASYRKNWGSNYQPPTFWEKFLAFLVRIIPKIGPLRVLQLRTPTPESERMFEASFNATLDRYRKLLKQVDSAQLHLTNENLDTGEIAEPGKYRLNDETHAKLLHELAKQNFGGVSPEIRDEMLEFYNHPDATYATKRNSKAWKKVQAELQELKQSIPGDIAADGTGGSLQPGCPK